MVYYEDEDDDHDNGWVVVDRETDGEGHLKREEQI